MTDAATNREQNKLEKKYRYYRSTAFFRFLCIPSAIAAYVLYGNIVETLEYKPHIGFEMQSMIFACALFTFYALWSFGNWINKLIVYGKYLPSAQDILDKEFNDPLGLSFRFETGLCYGAADGARLLLDPENKEILFWQHRKGGDEKFVVKDGYFTSWHPEWTEVSKKGDVYTKNAFLSIRTNDFNRPIINIWCRSKVKAERLSQQLTIIMS